MPDTWPEPLSRRPSHTEELTPLLRALREILTAQWSGARDAAATESLARPSADPEGLHPVSVPPMKFTLAANDALRGPRRICGAEVPQRERATRAAAGG